LDSRVTLTRALNTATRVNSSGYIETVNANLPRFDFDPVTLVCKGLLIEESRTNLLLRSSEFNSTWFLDAATISADTETAPDGTTTADKLVETTATAPHDIYQGVGSQPIGTYTFSMYVKPAGRTKFRLQQSGTSSYAVLFDLTALTVTTVVGGATGVITNAGNGWYRCSMTYTTVAAFNHTLVLFLANAAGSVSYAGDGTSGVFMWGAQLETGAFPTSYIPTTSTSLTRNADAVDMTSTNFSSWYNASEGTLFAEASTFSNASTDKFVANINNNGFPNRILMNFTATNNFSASVVSNSVPQVSGTNGTATTLNTPIKMCFATKLNSFAFSQSGVAPTTSVSGAMPVTVDRLWIGGANTSSFLNGHMRQVKYWPQRLTNAEVQAFSK
jgi:hypothetical protein